MPLPHNQLDSKGNPLIPGRLYCLATYNRDTENDVTYGSLAWFGSNGELYDANYPETAESVVDEDYDFLVLQVGDVNQNYLFDKE